jgi:hypothetical protein
MLPDTRVCCCLTPQCVLLLLLLLLLCTPQTHPDDESEAQKLLVCEAEVMKVCVCGGCVRVWGGGGAGGVPSGLCECMCVRRGDEGGSSTDLLADAQHLSSNSVCVAALLHVQLCYPPPPQTHAASAEAVGSWVEQGACPLITDVKIIVHPGEVRVCV